MTSARPRSCTHPVFLLIIASALACDGPETNKSSCTGNEHCACYGNETCSDGLVCRSKICVKDGGFAGAAGGGEYNTAAGGTALTSNGGSVDIGVGGATIATNRGGAPAFGGGGNNSFGSAGSGATSADTAEAGSGATHLGPNQIKNGDFSQGTATWHVTTDTGDELSTSSISDGAYCISASTYAQIIGWPAALSDAAYLQPGGTYSLSFRVFATDSASITAKVGYFSSPYTAVYESRSSSTSTTWQLYRYTFLVDLSSTVTQSTAMGLALTVNSFTSGLVCLDDVVLALVFDG